MPDGDGQAGSPGWDGFHKHEIHGVALVRCDLNPRAGNHLIERAF